MPTVMRALSAPGLGPIRIPVPIRKSLAAAALAAAMVAGSLAVPASATVVVDAAGTSAAGNPVAFRATLEIVGDLLTIDLENLSPVPTRDPADVLGSFYFDIERDGMRPEVVEYLSASGQVVKVLKGADEPVVYSPPAVAGGVGTVDPGFGLSDLMAVKAGDYTWQFRRLDPTFEPLAAFGLGTVGNSNLAPSNFDPVIVDQNDFTIYRGPDADPRGNLPGRLLVREWVRFGFRIRGGEPWGESDIGHRFTFGLGTSPSSTIVTTLPEPGAQPAAIVAVAAAAAGMLARRRGRQAARRTGQVCGPGCTAEPSESRRVGSSSGTLACRPISRDTNTAM